MKKTINTLCVLLFSCFSLTAQTIYDGIDFNYISNIANNGYLNTNPINGSDNENNLLTGGKTIIYKTNEGRYGKFEVQEYGYNLTIRWTTYNNNGTIYTTGSNLVITGTWLCDLDLGKKTQVSADFWWNQMTNIERYLSPKNNAVFYRVPVKAPKTKKPAPTTEVQTETSVATGEDRIVGKDAQGRTLYAGPRGSQYYINSNGNKTYVKIAVESEASAPTVIKAKKEFKRKNFAPQGNIPNTDAYYQIDFQAIIDSENKMREDINLGGLEGTPVQLKPGSIVVYKTSKDNFGKMQILSFGKVDTISELYTRWETYDKDKNLINSNELGERIAHTAQSRFEDLDGSGLPGYDYFWEIKNNLLFIRARKDAKFYLLKDNDSFSAQETNKQNAGQQSSTSGNISWQVPLSNNSTTNNATFDLKACVETSESIREYILVQNGLKMAISRGLIPRKATDCINTFSYTVTLKNGENAFYLIAQTPKGYVKSDVFTVFYDPNTVPPPQYARDKTRRLALVIGNADYVGNNILKNPINDATDISAALRDIGFEVMTVTNTNLRKTNETIDEFGDKLKNYDIGFFYYAGHGLQVNGENYLVPIDAKPKSEGEVAYECFPMGKLLAKMADASNRANIIVLDACRDNPLKRSWSRSTGGSGLANMNAPSGTFIGFATAIGSTAADGNGRNGVFTSALLEHIRSPNLSVDQLFNNVSGSVKKTTNNQQIPWKASSFSEDLYLTR